MASVFTKIINGEISCYKIAETTNCLAFLDLSPLVVGHVLVIPKKEIDYLFAIENDLYQELMLFAKTVSKAIKSVIPCRRIGVAVIGLEVPHAHIHLIPINSVSDINFSRTKLSPSSEELEQTAGMIRNAFGKIKE